MTTSTPGCFCSRRLNRVATSSVSSDSLTPFACAPGSCPPWPASITTRATPSPSWRANENLPARFATGETILDAPTAVVGGAAGFAGSSGRGADRSLVSTDGDSGVTLGEGSTGGGGGTITGTTDSSFTDSVSSVVGGFNSGGG